MYQKKKHMEEKLIILIVRMLNKHKCTYHKTQGNLCSVEDCFVVTLFLGDRSHYDGKPVHLALNGATCVRNKRLWDEK